ncbi:hypothetical protein JG687_00001328 [Phytophthora cactorum]|uniref:Uncharacterized protein n=1 Tax=Phytophthora cactorum TaxID=29920 RepID=A0A8T1UXP3_9STRA|nr:hypothetical protein JG687_00001328 [Phytophthora cactorum]
MISPTERASDTRPPVPVASSSGRRKIDKALKKPAANTTLVQLGQTVARGNVPAESLSPSGSSNQHSRTPTRKRAISNDLPRTLDGFLLLDWCRVEFPDEVIQAVLSDMHITDVVAEDLLFFTNLARLDMSDNEAPLEPFGCLPALVELDFQCNALEGITLSNGFQSLESALTLEEKRGAGFYNLIYLNLAHNMITDEEAVVYTSELRSLHGAEQGVDQALDSLITTAKKLNLTYNQSPQGSEQTRKT